VWWWIVAAVLLCSGCVSAERDSMVFYTWTKRGQAAGDSVRLFCTQAATYERRMFSYGFEGQAGAIRLTIDCGHGATSETIPYK